MDDINYYYTTTEWEKGRIGKLSAPGLLDIKVATPPEFPKGVEGLWSPEHLFSASANLCLMLTFIAIAENSKLEFISYSSEAKAKMEKVNNKLQITAIDIYPKIKLKNEEDKEKALRLIDKSEANCIISLSIKSEVKIYPEITI